MKEKPKLSESFSDKISSKFRTGYPLTGVINKIEGGEISDSSSQTTQFDREFVGKFTCKTIFFSSSFQLLFLFIYLVSGLRRRDFNGKVTDKILLLLFHIYCIFFPRLLFCRAEDSCKQLLHHWRLKHMLAKKGGNRLRQINAQVENLSLQLS